MRIRQVALARGMSREVTRRTEGAGFLLGKQDDAELLNRKRKQRNIVLSAVVHTGNIVYWRDEGDDLREATAALDIGSHY